MQEIKPMKKKRGILAAILILLLALLGLALVLFWPVIQSAASVERLEDGLYSMEYGGNYGLETFLEQGGASSDRAVADFVIARSFHGVVDLNLQGSQFGCSTLSVTSPEGEALFGRNFDWGACTALIVQTKPAGGYASISTVNMDFLDLGLALSESAFVRLMSVAAPYAPMDGMHLYDNDTAAAIAEHVGTADWRLPINHYDDYDNWEVMQFYDIPSRYEIPSNPERITSEKAGTVYYSEPNRIVLFFGDAEVSSEYTPIGYIDYSQDFVDAVENNPVLEGWGNKIVNIGD